MSSKALLIVACLLRLVWCTGPFSFQTDNNLCNKTFQDANATGVYSFKPGVVQGKQAGQPDNDSGVALNASWALTISQNTTYSEVTMWYSTTGANYSDDFSLGYDVCLVWVQNITTQAQFNGQNDNGTCLSTFDQDCISALEGLATDTANGLVTTPSSYGPTSNLTGGVLPTICTDIANTIKDNLPKECKKYWNETVSVQGNAMTDFNGTSYAGDCCSDFQERSQCAINETFWAINEEFYVSTDPLIYNAYSWEVYPMLTVFMPLANYERTAEITTTSHLTCVHIDHFNEGAKAAPPMPSPTGQGKGLTGGDIAGIVIGVLAAVAIIAGVAFWFLRSRKRKGAADSKEEKTAAAASGSSPNEQAQNDNSEKKDPPIAEAPAGEEAQTGYSHYSPSMTKQSPEEKEEVSELPGAPNQLFELPNAERRVELPADPERA